MEKFNCELSWFLGRKIYKNMRVFVEGRVVGRVVFKYLGMRRRIDIF